MAFQLDARIPLGVEQPQPFNGLAALGQVRQQQQEQRAAQQQEELRGIQLQNARVQQETAKGEAHDVETWKTIIGNPDLTPDAVLEQIKVKLPGKYDAAVARKQKIDADALEIKQAKMAYADRTKQWIGGQMEDIAKNGYDPVHAEVTLKQMEALEPDFAPKAAEIRQTILAGGPAALKAIVDAQRPKAPAKEGFTLGEGQTRFGPEGQTIASVAKPVEAITPYQQAGLTETHRANVARERQAASAASAGDAAVSLSPEALALTAKQFAMTGMLPPMGMGKAAAQARTNIINAAAKEYAGLDLPSQVAAYKASKDSLAKLQVQRDAMGAFEETAGKNMDQFLETAKKVVDTGSPLLNKSLRSMGGALMGSPEMTAYNVARRTVIPEYAKILANPGLSGQLSDSARKEIEDVVSGDATLAQTYAAAKILRQDTKNRAQAYDDQIKAVQERIARPPGSAKAAEPAAAGKTITVTAPDGSKHPFATQKEADAFKQLAGIK